MKPYELLTFPEPQALARAAAEAWLQKVEAANSQARSHPVALSGGRIARDFFGAIAETAKQRGISLACVHFFWSDERCVPPGHPESNFRLANECLFEPVAVSQDRIHRIHGELPPEEAARQAAVELRQFLSSSAPPLPVLDLIFLGMGEDGHVASLFPDLPAEQANSGEAYLAVTASKPPPQRVTLSYAKIGAAQEVWVLASGPGKEKALQESLQPNGRTPLARVLRMRKETRIFSAVSR